MDLARKERRPVVAARAYHRLVRLAHKQLGLATTYAEDGAMIDAARCATEAAVTFFKTAIAKQHLLRVQQEK